MLQVQGPTDQDKVPNSHERNLSLGWGLLNDPKPYPKQVLLDRENPVVGTSMDPAQRGGLEGQASLGQHSRLTFGCEALASKTCLYPPKRSLLPLQF